MENFGVVKSKILSKLTESYSSQNKNEMKNIIKTIKENKNFKELYLLYEDIENKYFSDEKTAMFYVDALSDSLKGRKKSISKICKELNESLSEIQTTTHDVYSLLDTLLEEDTLLNIAQKVNTKMELVKFLTTKKEIVETKIDTYSNNESLLFNILVNDFNTLYDETLNEEEKNELKQILSLNDDEINIQINETKNSIIKKIESLILESKDNELLNTLQNTKLEVEKTNQNRYNLYKLKQLENGLN